VAQRQSVTGETGKMISDGLLNYIKALSINDADKGQLVISIEDEITGQCEATREIAYHEGHRKGYEDGYSEGRQDAMRNVESNVMGYNSLPGYDRERLMRIVRTGSPY